MGNIFTMSETSNMGIAFVAFKDKDCVWETLDEIDTVKHKLIESQSIRDLGLLDW